jgi:uncharacterized peroxidase-related enzyme
MTDPNATADPAATTLQFRVHTIETAPSGSAAILAEVRRTTGFVPNLYAVMAGAPSLLKGYLALGKLFDESSLTPLEQQVVALTASVSNACEYCVAAHSVIAGMKRVPEETVRQLREGHALDDSRLEALRQFTAGLVTRRGHPTADEVAAMRAAGFREAQVLEVILGVGMKTISNYMNHLVHTPLDTAFSAAAWVPPSST